VPKVHVSLATVWDAFTSAGLAFDPLPLPLSLPQTICGGSSTTSHTDISSIQSEGKSKEKEGVFPLSYLGGIDAMFIAIADSSERAIELYGLARQMIEGLEK
jgi:hypothetical protein